MEAAPLKNFATWARKELIREVTARIAAVLAPGSPERVEQAKAIAALEKAVTAAGGGDKGRAAVADKVAYAWFNRIIALRFMDANGYTGIGVVSPQAGVEVGQPEILAEAKRGVIDADLVSDATRKTVAALLDGPRTSGDPQGEAYALLLEAYCNYWHKAMPFMFEREGDFTEMLVPANLLADESVLNRSVKVLTEDVCEDVEVIGWLYQFYISERKDEVFAGFKKNKKAGAEEIPAATQLFTPHWIVRYLVENSLGRLWMLNRPNSGLVDRMDYYISPVDEETDFLKITKPEELRVIDPACGSGHMLTYAFDLLYAIYEEEGYGPAEIPGLILTHNLYGTEIDPRAGVLAAFALTMKAVSKRKLFLKNAVEPNVCVLDPISFSADELSYLVTKDGDRYAEEAFWNQFGEADTFGSLITPDPALIRSLARHLETVSDNGDMYRADALDWARQTIRQAEFLSPRYSVVVANPPYMGSKNMSSGLASFAAEKWPRSKADLMTMFMERAAALVERGGFWAMINLPSWMFLSTFTTLRGHLLDTNSVQSLLQLGRGVFGSDFGSTAFVMANVPPKPSTKGVYRRLFDEPGQVRSNARIEQLFLDEAYNRYVAEQREFRLVPGTPIAYWLPNEFFESFKLPARIGDAAKKGLSCGSTDTFYRLAWEVSKGRISDPNTTWVPITKGGPVRKWYGNTDHVIFWANGGRAIREAKDSKGRPSAAIRNESYYFGGGVSWNDVSMTGVLSARFTPEGSIPTDSGPMIYATGPKRLEILGFLNSTAVRPFTDLLCPTIHFGVGQLALFPLPDEEDHERDERIRRLVEIAREDWDERETSMDFVRNPILVSGSGSNALRDAVERTMNRWTDRVEEALGLERENDAWYLQRYGLDKLAINEAEASDITLQCNPANRFSRLSEGDAEAALQGELVSDFISYAVGCMFGRYSLDEPGLILADQGVSLRDYLAKVPTPTFTPDADNVIPIVDGDWFEDDIVERFRQFLRAAFGEQHFEENLRFVTESLGVKNLRDYFVKFFYKDHVQRYKKRPIYWLFSSHSGSFNALIYMHRYTPSTVSTVLNEYLREFQAKLKASLDHAERSNNAKEADRLRKTLLELDAYEHDVLYPLASQNIAIDLDDGVKVNYPKFGSALKKIVGLEAAV